MVKRAGSNKRRRAHATLRTTVTLRSWQRRHAGGVVAEVVPVAGAGVWRASACVDSERIQSDDDRSFLQLRDAHGAADVLARAQHPHQCDERCSEWEPVERRVGAAAEARHPRRRNTD